MNNNKLDVFDKDLKHYGRKDSKKPLFIAALTIVVYTFTTLIIRGFYYGKLF
jgi:hypothetical protein